MCKLIAHDLAILGADWKNEIYSLKVIFFQKVLPIFLKFLHNYTHQKILKHISKLPTYIKKTVDAHELICKACGKSEDGTFTGKCASADDTVGEMTCTEGPEMGTSCMAGKLCEFLIT